MSPTRWISEFNAIGVKTKPTKNGGTFAHRDIALEFASWISPEIRLYVIKEFQRLKIQESEQLEWYGKRMLTKLNYLIHTDAIKEYLLPVELTKDQINYVYASEADVLNVALFGKSAKEWYDENPDKKGNIRDYASTLELAILSNIEFQNAKLIEQGFQKRENVVLVIAATNRPWDIDSALLRPGRLDTLVYVDLPNKEARNKMLNNNLKKILVENDIVDYLAASTEGYNGSDIKEICDELIRIVIDKEIHSIKNYLITFEDCVGVLKEKKSSVSKIDVEII